ncbi:MULTISPECIES: lysozyme [unclassified Mesorhizobium]|uniref:lysozyme n=1 Tax=unclassified Mesorhizobium TaxID=325217 RepID=UPI000F74DB62|nr:MULTISPECIES: lysozyme [unclassified Mesorhizobium]AZO54873.1 glycoside hydrolase [Mesorhizobium sp. M8A.F.Ca.ET.057.01.1.1]RWE44145.1 MAG: glycoside hydrolase [Mesorhizobium sp.]
MPINKIRPSRRAIAAIAAVVVAAGAALMPSSPPPAVTLAVDSLIIPWEGLVLHSHWDRYAEIYDICYGETQIDGKPVKAGMTRTKEQCHDMLMTRVVADYYKPLTRCIAGYTSLPVSLQASLLSGAYNFGVAAACKSRAAKFATAKQYRQACEAQTAFNKAGGHTVQGLVLRREMGDAQRIGEAELCVSGLPQAGGA